MLSAFQRNGRLNFDALQESLSQALQASAEACESAGCTASYPVDIREDQSNFYVDAEVPGFTKDQIQVTLDKGVLQIVATRPAPAKPAAPAAESAQAPSPAPEKAPAPEPATHLRERAYTRIARAFKLPPSVDDAKVQAKLENGVLYLTLSKREEVRPRKVQID
jgi:HSP20 family protein